MGVSPPVYKASKEKIILLDVYVCTVHIYICM